METYVNTKTCSLRSLCKAWKLYSKVRDEIEKVKSEQGKPDASSTSGNSRWSIGAPFGGRRGSFSSLVGFGIKSQAQNDAGVEGGSGEVDKDVEDCLEFGIGLFYFVVSIVSYYKFLFIRSLS